MQKIKPLPLAGTKVRAKYRLSEFIGQYADRKEIRLELKEILGISDASFSIWENMAIDDERVIKSHNIKQIAKYFGKEITEMTN